MPLGDQVLGFAPEAVVLRWLLLVVVRERRRMEHTVIVQNRLELGWASGGGEVSLGTSDSVYMVW